MKKMKEYIEREAAIFDLEIYEKQAIKDEYALAIAGCRSHIRNIPAADVVEVRHSRWLRPLSPYAWYKCSCELCGYEAPDSGWTAEAWEMDWYEEQIRKFVEAHPFCTRCGAKMDGGVNDA